MAETAHRTRDAAAEQERLLLQVIHRIRIFSSISPHHGKDILTRCAKRTLKQGEVLCRQGEESQSLYVLLTGKLSVSITNSATIATIYPVETIGELGVFTGHPRNATVEAMEPAVVLELKRDILNALIDKSPELGIRVMRKIIEQLAERVDEDNGKLRELQNYVINQENRKPAS